MVLYVGLPDPTESRQKGTPVPKHTIHFLTSPDLKEWTLGARSRASTNAPTSSSCPSTATGRRRSGC